METDYGELVDAIEKVRGIAQQIFPTDKFHVRSTIWETGNFEVTAKHGHKDSKTEEVVIRDEEGNIVYQERVREFEGEKYRVRKGEILESREFDEYEEWAS